MNLLSAVPARARQSLSRVRSPPHEGPAASIRLISMPWRPGKKAIEMFDTDKDGKLSGKELDKCPGLKAACTPPATTCRPSIRRGTGEITAEMITDRIRAWQASRLGRMSLRCMVTHNGRPLEGATVKFVPEPFLGPNMPTATGLTDQNGVAMLTIPTGENGGPPGVPPGFFRVEITKAGLKIPAKYNKETIFGQEVAIDAPAIRSGIKFDLEFDAAVGCVKRTAVKVRTSLEFTL